MVTLVTNAILRLSCASVFVTNVPQKRLVTDGDKGGRLVTNCVRTPKNTLAGAFGKLRLCKPLPVSNGDEMGITPTAYPQDSIFRHGSNTLMWYHVKMRLRVKINL